MSRAVFRRSRALQAVPGMALGVALGCAMLALPGCSAGPMGGVSDDAVGPSGTASGGNADLATQQACRQRVNEMYEVRDRSDLYPANPSSNTPFSANYQPDVPSRGLASQFAYERSIAECEHNAQTGAEPVAPPPPAGMGR